VSSALLPAEDDGTNITNAVTPAVPTPLSTAELVRADRRVALRRRGDEAADRDRDRVGACAPMSW
jgi:hypothetical protein